MFHFIRHSFLGGIATSTGLIIALGTLLIAGGFFALLWFGLAIYAAVAIGVLLVLLAAALTHRCLFSRIPSVVCDLVLYWEGKVAKPFSEVVAKLRYRYVPLPVKIVSGIGYVLLCLGFFVLAVLPLLLIIMLLLACIVSLMAIPLAFLLSPLLMTFLAFASSISLASFILASLAFIGIIFILGLMLICLDLVYLCIMEPDNEGVMLRLGVCFIGVALLSILTVLLLIPTGFFVVYLLPSLISALTFTMPVWASCVGLALLFGVALYGMLLYARQAVFDFRLSCLAKPEPLDDQPSAIASIKFLLEQGATLEQWPTLKRHQRHTRGAAQGMAYSSVLTHYFLHFFWLASHYRLRSVHGPDHGASIISNGALPLVWLCLASDAPKVNRAYRGHAIDLIIAGNVEISPTDKKLLLVKLLFACGEQYPEFYQQIKVSLREFVGDFVSDHLMSPFLYITPEAGESDDKMESDVENILYACETGLKCGGVFYQTNGNDWFICYYRDRYLHKQITSPGHLEELGEHAWSLSSIHKDKKLEAYQVLQRMTESMGISIPLHDWKQAAKDMLYYAVKSGLFSEEDLEALLTDCSKEPFAFSRLAPPNEDKKAALRALIASFAVDRADLLGVLKDTLPLPTTIAELIVGYYRPYANPDERGLPVLNSDAVATTLAVG